MKIHLPHAGIVLLIGASSSGKSTWLQRAVDNKDISPSEIVSSDTFRILVSDTDFIDTVSGHPHERELNVEQYRAITAEAFSLLQQTVEARCRLNKLTFVDATNLSEAERKVYFTMAKKQHVPIYGLLLDLPLETLLKQDELRENPRGKARMKQQARKIQEQKRVLKKEPFTRLYQASSIEELQIVRHPSPLYLEIGQGLDMIGDIHGCFDEMILLLEKLGYVSEDGLYTHPDGRKLLSLGDIMSRGPKSLETMQFWQRHIEAGVAYMIDSNHGYKIARFLEGQKVTLRHGDELIEQELTTYEQQHGYVATEGLKRKLTDMLRQAPSHYVLTKNSVPYAVAVHAGIRDRYIGKDSPRIRDFCRYGDVTGLTENGRPIRSDWYTEHQSPLLIIWGHDPQPKPLKINQTLNIDQGVVFGGALTALRYPEETVESVPAMQDYAQDAQNPLLAAQAKRFDPPNIQQFINGFQVETVFGHISIQAGQAKAAIDTVSHYTVPLEQLVYIPPTMSPTPVTSSLPDYLEHPQEAFDYYRKMGVTELIAEKKHMGSRAVILLFKTLAHAKQAIDAEVLGVITTRTGRAFFAPDEQQHVLQLLHDELTTKNYFERHQTDFVLMDAEILPWNLKAQSLIDAQYAHVAENALMDRQRLLQKLQRTQLDVANWQAQYTEYVQNAARFDAVYQNYIWDANLTNIQIAPFHILAHSNETCFHQPHSWHMEQAQELAQDSKLFIATEYRAVSSTADEQAVINWWTDITEIGHEGIVIKPMNFITKHQGKLIQPAIKVRGREYLRIIYGMDYTDPAQLAKLKKRNSQKKMRHALQEFSLGVEGISRFVSQQNTTRIHACVLATLALESDAVDPRL